MRRLIGLFVFVLLAGCSAVPGEKAAGDLTDSVKYYTKMLDEMPGEPLVYYNRGVYYFRMGKYNDALSDFTNALRLDPGKYFIYQPRGDCHRLLGNFSQAISNYDSFLVSTGGNIHTYASRAYCYFELKEYQAAAIDYSKVIMLDGSNAEAYTQRGLSYYNAGEYNKAAGDLQQAIVLSPDSAKAYVWLGNAQYHLEQWEESINAYQLAIEKGAVLGRDSYLPEAYVGRAKSLEDDDPGQALKDISEALALDSVNAEAIYHRGLIIFNMGDAQSACADFRKAGMLGITEAFDEMKVCCGTAK